MALKIHTAVQVAEAKPVVQTVSVETPIQTLTETEALVQEYLVLYQKLEEIDGKNVLRRMETIRKTLVEYANELGPDDQTFSFSSPEGYVTFSERAQTTEVINSQHLINAIADKFGLDVAFACVKINLSELRKVLSEMELIPFVKKVPGARTVKGVVVEK